MNETSIAFSDPNGDFLEVLIEEQLVELVYRLSE
jgi:hypothetical protein